MIRFSSDPHYNHKNVLGYCNRPFSTKEEMDAEMIRRWNSIVKPNDFTYLLGDFAFTSSAGIANYRKQLNGEICLILGNHDKSQTAMLKAGFDEVRHYRYLAVNDTSILLIHNPADAIKAMETGGVQADIVLHGHVHEKYRRRGNYINVGVDQWDFKPVTLLELLEAQDDTSRNL